MNDPEIDFITTCAATLQQSSNHSQIMETLKQLQFIDMSIEKLKSTRIGAIVNKLTKRTNLPSKIHTFAWELVNNWKEIVTLSVTLEQQQSNSNTNNKKRSLSPEPITNTNTNTNTNNSLNPHKRQRLSHGNNSMFVGI
eukprot:351249_1